MSTQQMAEKIQSVRGMNDILPPDSNLWQRFEDTCKKVLASCGYEEIRTPICESTKLFSRGIGEATDIVEKEMYTFRDRKERQLTLRPEMTASCARAYIQHGVFKKQPVNKWYYLGPMFRYERMQTGRYRQFYQLGCEAFGSEESTVDAEQVALLHQIYSLLGVKNIDVLINSVGNSQDRPVYREALVTYLKPFLSDLCGDCQRRIESNPLRVLDCKVAKCKELGQEAPQILDHLGDKSKKRFDDFRQALDVLSVPYKVDSKVVRGLDYYTGAVFEMVGTSKNLGSHSTLGAGGRYDNLVESLGGPKTPAVGFALGIERGILSMDEKPTDLKPDVFIASTVSEAKNSSLHLAFKLRKLGLIVEFEHRVASFKSQFKRADKLGTTWVVSIGEDEFQNGTCKIKNMTTRAEESISLDKCEDFFSAQ